MIRNLSIPSMPCHRAVAALIMTTTLMLAACEKTPTPTPVASDALPGPVAGDCDIGDPTAQAILPAGADVDQHVLMNGRRITPHGTQIKVGTFPMGLAVDPVRGLIAVSGGGKSDASIATRAKLFPSDQKTSDDVTDFQALDLVDAASGAIKSTIAVRSLFVGLGFSPDGNTLYASGGGRDVMSRWDVTDSTKPKPLPTWSVYGYPAGMAIDTAGFVYVSLLHKHQVLKLDPATGATVATYTTQAMPLQPVLSHDEKRLYVSNWSTNTVSVVDLTTGKTLKNIVVGKNPEGIAVSSDNKTVYVAVSDADIVAVIDAQKIDAAPSSIAMNPATTAVVGMSPTDLKLSDDGKRLYVTLAHENSVAVVDTPTKKVMGHIPTAFYPTKVSLTPDQQKLLIVSAKGYGSGPSISSKPEPASIATGKKLKTSDAIDDAIAESKKDRDYYEGYFLLYGTLAIGSVPTDTELTALSAQVDANNQATRKFYSPTCDRVRNPVPLEFGDTRSPIKHVVYIVRENKTYDAVLGDLNDGKADKWHEPSLTLFGEKITPNLHKLAKQYSNNLNFYSESEQSVQGHIWTANGWVNDFSEKMWIAMWGRPGEAAIIAPGMEPGSTPPGGDLFQHMVAHGKSVRVYGEYSGVVAEMSDKIRDSFNWKFSGGFGVDDRVKAKEFIRELELGIFPEFVYMVLGNDHTFGGQAGKPTPTYMIGDNDEATGRVVEAISRSKFWKETVIFIIEDDPQSTPDHIDTHRSIGLVVSPWSKRGHQSEVLYSGTSIHKTASLILGVPPMNRLIELSSAMYDAFTGTPDFTPYEAIPSNIALAFNPDDGSEAALLSAKMDFSEYDRAPELGYVLWKMYKPNQAVPAGFHWPRSELIGNLDSPVLPDDDDDE